MFRIGILFLVFFIFPTVGHAKEITIVGDINEKPRIYIDDSEAKGYLPNILHYIEEKTDLTFQIKLYPWARAYFTAKKGHAAIIGISKTPERLKIFDYTIPVYFEDILVISTIKNPVNYNRIEDLYGKTVGITRGAVYSDEFEEAKKENKFEVFEGNSPSQRLNLLIYKRIDVAIIGSGQAGFRNALEESKLSANKQSNFIIAGAPLARDPNYIAFPKSMDALSIINKINNAVVEGYATGEIQKRLKY